MSRADDWHDPDNERRPRRRQWDEGDYEEMPLYRPEYSGAITGLAVISFVLGGLFILFSGCLGFCFIIQMGPGGGGARPANAGIFGGPGQESLLGIRSLAFFFWAVGTITAGVGLVNRQAWGRMLTLVLAAFGGLGGVGLILEGTLNLVQAQNLPAMRGPEQAFSFMVGLVVGLLLVVYTLWVYIVLLNSRYAEEFR